MSILGSKSRFVDDPFVRRADIRYETIERPTLAVNGRTYRHKRGGTEQLSRYPPS